VDSVLRTELPNRAENNMVFIEYESDWIRTQTGIPQRSPLSLILLLFFVSELLADYQCPEDETLAFSFVDNTNLITRGESSRELPITD
jgi:hypothetical protein